MVTVQHAQTREWDIFTIDVTLQHLANLAPDFGNSKPIHAIFALKQATEEG